MTVFAKRKRHDSGIVLPSVLALIFCGCVIISMFAIHAGRSMMLTRRALQYQRACVLSESGLGFGIMSVRSLISEIGWQKFSDRYGIGSIERLDGDKIPAYRISETDNGEYKNGVYFTVVNNDTSAATVDEGHIEVIVYAISQHRESGVASAVREKITIASSSLGQYAAFYTRDLEVWPGEQMVFKGKVHTNGDLYMGADANPGLTFERNVTAHGKFFATRKEGSGKTGTISNQGYLKFRKGDDENYVDEKPADYVDVIRVDAQGKKTRMDSSGLGNSWDSESEKYYAGAVRTDKMKLAPPISVNDDEHTIIERVKKSTDDGYNKDTEAVKFANKAALTIRFDSDGNIHLYSGKYVKGSEANEITYKENDEPLMLPATSVSKASQTTGKYNVTQSEYAYTDDNGNPQSKTLPAYQVSNYIYDQRENKPMALADIYVDQILNDPTLRGYLYPTTSDTTTDAEDEREAGVLYVTYDKETDGKPIGYPDITTTSRPTGQFQTIGTDTKTTTKETEKNNLVAQGYTVASTSTTTKYYIRSSSWSQQWTETNLATYNRTANNRRRMETVTTWTLTKTIQEEIMETVAVTNYIPVEPAVRLRNASDLRLVGTDADGKRRGLSIVTDLPMYVEGCFNTDNTKGGAFIADASGQTDKVDALVAADAVTMLSSSWDDEWQKPKWNEWNGHDTSSIKPSNNRDARVATETTFNGVLMTGIVESNGGTYSGGLENFFRFYENWQKNGKLAYNFNGSMVCMWTSNIANHPVNGDTYSIPIRKWGWAKMSPPGLPNLLDIKESGWERIDASQYGDSDFFD